MNVLLQPVRDYLVDLGKALVRGVNVFCFQPSDPTIIAAIRIITGSLLLYIHVATLPHLLDFVGPHGWVDQEAIRQLQHLPEQYESIEQQWLHTYFGQSIWFYVQAPAAMYAVEAVFLLAIVCFTLGLGSRVAGVLVWVGHISYANRSYLVWFGMDSVLSMLLLYLMFAPTGATLSLDRLITRYFRARRGMEGKGKPVNRLPLEQRWSATLMTRLIQIHMSIIYLMAGLAKLQGASWWSGTAAWYTMMVPEFELFNLRWLGTQPEWLYHLIVFGATYYTLIFEISFIFLVWNRWLRPLVLAGAVALHVGIGFFMGLGGFGVAMLTGCLAFVYPSSLRWLIAVFCQGPRGFQFVYDRNLPRQAQAAAWVRAADPYEQVTLVEAHEKGAATAGSLITPDGATLRGITAFWRLFKVLPCLWILWPCAVRSFR
jgi:hypothetical protein